MGKQGAFELNYSSDIDTRLFFEPDRLAPVLAEGVGGTEASLDALAPGGARLCCSERTADGYVFRVDLRLRPDPSSTPPVVAVPTALDYYESVGQNWERAAFIKAAPCCGDFGAARAFLEEMSPFVWRRNLDFAAMPTSIRSSDRSTSTRPTRG